MRRRGVFTCTGALGWRVQLSGESNSTCVICMGSQTRTAGAGATRFGRQAGKRQDSKLGLFAPQAVSGPVLGPCAARPSANDWEGGKSVVVIIIVIVNPSSTPSPGK